MMKKNPNPAGFLVENSPLASFGCRGLERGADAPSTSDWLRLVAAPAYDGKNDPKGKAWVCPRFMSCLLVACGLQSV